MSGGKRIVFLLIFTGILQQIRKKEAK